MQLQQKNKITLKKSCKFNSAKILKFYFGEKQKANASFSMRLLARNLKMSPSYVSEILNGKKAPSQDKIKLFEKGLGLDPLSKEAYKQSLYRDLYQDSTPDELTELSWKSLSQGDSDILRKWYFVVILDFVGCKSFKNDPVWIAKRLGITDLQAKQALHLLIQQKYLSEKNEKLNRTAKKIRFPTSKSHKLVRNYHNQMIDLAKQELNSKVDQDSFNRRLITGISFACNPTRIEKAKRKIFEALYSLADDLMEGDCSEVYQINLQLFPHTTPSKD